MAVEDVLKIKARQSLKDLESLVRIITCSEENFVKFAEIRQLVGVIINQISVDNPDKERVEETCENLIEVAQEYNDSGENLEIKKAASQLAKRITVIDHTKYGDFIQILRREDEHGVLKFLTQIKTGAIEIVDVKFKDTGVEGNVIRGTDCKLDTNVEYLTPQITYKVLQTGSPVEIWYKIYSPSGILIFGDKSKAGFTWKGAVNCEAQTTFTVTLGGFGNTDKSCYKETGTWRIEFYEGDKCLYKTTFEIIPVVSKPTPKPTSQPTPKPIYRNVHDSSWKKFNNKIKRIGDWFASEKTNDVIAGVLYIGLFIVYIVSIILAWREDGFWNALLAGVLGLFVLGVAVIVAAFSVKIFLWVFRAIFYNVWTLFIALAFIISPMFITTPFIKNLFDKSSQNQTKVEPIKTVISTTTYYCTSKSGLKIRRAPSINAAQLGSLTYGETVEVIEVTGDFAKIKYEHADSGFAWVSSKYISTTRPEQTTETVKTSQIPQIETVKIISVSFANTDYNNNVLTGYGGQLYSDKLQYLAAKVSIKPLNVKKSYQFNVKIYRPDRSLISGTTSPAGCTFSQVITISNNSSSFYLMGWGSTKSTVYPPGIYKYEIWLNGAKLHTETIDIKPAKITMTQETASSVKQNEVYETVEQKPEFPGGNTELIKFMQENVKYPREAIENNIQGRVVVQFVVEQDGSISNPVVSKSVNSLLDKEAVRVVSIMPKWKPGEQRGEKVRVRYTLPVTFRLGN